MTWQAEGTSGAHNVHFAGEVAPLGAASMDFNDSRQFPDAGTYRYHCDVHAT